MERDKIFEKEIQVLDSCLPVKREEPKYLTFPNSPASNSVMNVVSHAGNLKTFANRLEQTSHTTKLEFFVPPKGTDVQSCQRVRYSTDNIETTVHLDNIDVFSKNSKPIKKFLTYTLVKLSKSNFSSGYDHDICIRFPLSDFIDLGCYKSMVTARQAFNQAKIPLTGIRIEGVVRDLKNMRQITDSGIEVLFTGAHIKKGIVEIYLNRRINWELFALQYFSILPKSYFSLPDNAADTMLNIFMLARKRINEIGKNGYFTVGFRTLQQILDLPDETATKNPSRDIKGQILNALEEVRLAEKGDMDINPVFNPNGNIVEFLEQGYAEVRFFNEYLEYFSVLSSAKKRRIESARKKTQEIQEKARVKAAADRIRTESV